MASLRYQLGSLLPGATARRRQVGAHSEAWRLANEGAGPGEGSLWVVLGDSTAQAVGAASIDGGYVAAVRAWLAERDGMPWRVVNLSRSGARAADVVAEQLPVLATLTPDLVSCAVGANDLIRPAGDLGEALTAIARGLPPGSLLANLPRGLREARARRHNEVIGSLVERHHLRLVDLWAATGPPWRGKYAADWFHPNEVGYQGWAAALRAALSQP